MGTRKSVLLHEMTLRQVEEYLARRSDPVAMVIVGSIEQHGPHLPLGRDIYGVRYVAEQAARAVDAVVVQPAWAGFSPHHLGFVGCVSFRAETLKRVILDTVASLVVHGFDRVLVLNGHGGNSEIVTYSVSLARQMLPISIIGLTEMNTLRPIPGTEDRFEKLDMHGGTGETERQLVTHPETVDMESVKDWKPTTVLPDELLSILRNKELETSLVRTLVMAYIPDTHEFTSSGVYGFASPNDYDLGRARLEIKERIEYIVKLVELWRTIPLRRSKKVIDHSWWAE